MTTRDIIKSEFDTAEELAESIDMLRLHSAAKGRRLTIKDSNGVEFNRFTLVEETLSDGSKAVCFVLSRADDEDDL